MDDIERFTIPQLLKELCRRADLIRVRGLIVDTDNEARLIICDHATDPELWVTFARACGDLAVLGDEYADSVEEEAPGDEDDGDAVDGQAD